MRYNVEVKEINYGTVQVEASSPEEAIAKAELPIPWAIPFGNPENMSFPMPSGCGTETVMPGEQMEVCRFPQKHGICSILVIAGLHCFLVDKLPLVLFT